MEKLEGKQNYELAKKIEQFLSEYDSPPFGYAPGLDGQENAEQWTQTILEDIECGEGWTKRELIMVAGDGSKDNFVREEAKEYVNQIDTLDIQPEIHTFTSLNNQYDHIINEHFKALNNQLLSLNLIQGLRIAYKNTSQDLKPSTKGLLEWLQQKDGGIKAYDLIHEMDKQHYINIPDSMTGKNMVWNHQTTGIRIEFDSWDAVAEYVKEISYQTWLSYGQEDEGQKLTERMREEGYEYVWEPSCSDDFLMWKCIHSDEVFGVDGWEGVSDFLEHRHYTYDIKKRLFVDLDGTAAEFRHVDTLETLYEKGYFLNLKPIQNVVDAIKIMTEKPDVEVFCLSSVLTDSHYALEEKNAWVDKNLPEIDSSHRLFPPCGENKRAYVLDKTGYISKADFLFDDYTKNLMEWDPPGRGIKALNGINHSRGTWPSSMISNIRTSESIAEAICQCMNGEIVTDKMRGVVAAKVLTVQPLP